MKTITSYNPTTEEKLKEYNLITPSGISKSIEQGQKAFEVWKTYSFEKRQKLMKKVALLLQIKKREYAEIITLEMGKTLKSALSEVEKCAWVCEHFAEHAQKYLADEAVKTEAKSAHVIFQPLGIIFAVMPWNFPFWQVFRFASPALMAGNVGLLKHASNVPQCALSIQEIFEEADFPKGVFQSLLISSSDSELVIKDPRIKAVALTGSNEAGSKVASIAGKYIKKSVLELGGSDPFIVLDDADIKKAAANAAFSRLIVSGQSCIAAKRFIVSKGIADDFLREFKKNMESMKVGNPLDEATHIGPLANQHILDTIAKQLKQSISKGAKIITGGKRIGTKGYFFEPTIVTVTKNGMKVWDEEVFGPIAVVRQASTDKEALEFANDSIYGLGASVWTKSQKRAEYFINNLESGCVFVNSIVKSDSRLPFGGIKQSGFGRELGSYGIKEFVNVKTIWIE